MSRMVTGLVLSLLLSETATAGEVYFDYAPVSWVVPITESVRTGDTAPCPTGQPDTGQPGSGLSGETGAGGMAAAIRTLARSGWSTDCADPATEEERVVAYRVGYVYGGEEYVRVLRRDPGNRVRVRVSLEASP